MQKYLTGKEKFYYLLCSPEELDKRLREKAAKKIQNFWRRRSKVLHIPDELKEFSFDDQIARWFAEQYTEKGWAMCRRKDGDIWEPRRYYDAVSLFRVKGKKIWKVEIVLRNCYQEVKEIIPFYLRPCEEERFIYFETPFVFSFKMLTFCFVGLRFHGEEISKVQVKGCFTRKEKFESNNFIRYLGDRTCRKVNYLPNEIAG
ncbi:hypothetical protein GMAR_ORF32 [Golden Marseillevirus]|uniref:hypothetical protein n=1 Tax=Golden Marseillevirus TaxID=1720526 RepID=UPI000877AA39|nr:hypothetical protein GMAR_ORF32 [Golden Marseillevirus]ALX27407.1 hypothetical protein GMAR_ORF32 [Golden Marseillevirus]